MAKLVGSEGGRERGSFKFKAHSNLRVGVRAQGLEAEKKNVDNVAIMCKNKELPKYPLTGNLEQLRRVKC